ncbi:uncharacterized protein SOCG_05377 [Schizosaccharomyces octosporus yFS286]|uniref:Uncharacterized protein n=1 Tax=Schizosaccharomyces octosporus (strain yFS286) TaxID=483514 RepID=S9RMZ1_SCHOY|nr:uncharacterized protein SOCG_05377 [Schizosaccharomyces octosporus yFS286]EPX75334.1 hypothetical protein SOCG_05377 [Schizosaccharomyces octosporus yFS286]
MGRRTVLSPSVFEVLLPLSSPWKGDISYGLFFSNKYNLMLVSHNLKLRAHNSLSSNRYIALVIVECLCKKS